MLHAPCWLKAVAMFVIDFEDILISTVCTEVQERCVKFLRLIC